MCGAGDRQAGHNPAPRRCVRQGGRPCGRFALAGGAATVIDVVLGFLLVPIGALVSYQPPDSLIDWFGTKVVTDAILVSLKTNGVAFVLMIAFGTPMRFAAAFNAS